MYYTRFHYIKAGRSITGMMKIRNNSSDTINRSHNNLLYIHQKRITGEITNEFKKKKKRNNHAI